MRGAFCAVVVSLIGLAGCGGGGGGGGAGAYEPLVSSAPVTSTLGGVSVRVSASGVRLVDVTGTTNHASGATTISDGVYTLIDSDGADGNYTLTDGTAIFDAPAPGTLGTQSYTYVGGYSFSYPGISSRVVGGVITQAADMPTGGSASYFGDAQGGYSTGVQSVFLEGGTASVAVDFGGGLVDVAMTGFSGKTAGSGAPVATPLVDAITATGMTISGNRFSGGTVTLSRGGTALTPTGSNPTDSAAGAFFGLDAATGQPAEVGGAVVSTGTQRAIYGMFVAK